MPYIEVEPADIEVANQLITEVLGRSLDELPPQTRRLLLLIAARVGEECGRLQMERADYRFSRRDARVWTGWGNTQLKVHLKRLEELEYVLVHRGGRGQSFVYELLYEGSGEDGRPVLPGLIEVEKLRYDEKKSGSSKGWAGSGRGHVGGVSGPGRMQANAMLAGTGGQNAAVEA